MGWLVILKLVPLVLSLVRAAEEIFGGRQMGVEKKKMVVGALDGVVGGKSVV